MNCVAHDASLNLEAWELEISATVHPDKEHLGVFADERAAARAVDRSCIQRLGLDAMTSFPLVDYLDMLGSEHIQAAVNRGLLPPVLPMSYTPPPVPTPILQLQQQQDVPSTGLRRLLTPRPDSFQNSPVSLQAVPGSAPEVAISGHSHNPATSGTGQQQVEDTGTQVVARRTSVTPRSVFDFMEFQTMLTGAGAGKRTLQEVGEPCKKPRLKEEDCWIQDNDLAMLDLQL